MSELFHHGILGQKWGKTNGPPYPLDYGAHSKAEIRMAKKDAKWIKKKEEKIKTKAYNKSEKEMRAYVKELSKRSDSYLSNGKLSSTYVNNYNRKLAEVMNKNVGDIEAPSGKVVQFVAKRGELGVYTALADRGYDMNQVKNGVWSDARVGYKKNTLDTIHTGMYYNNSLIHHGIKGQKWGVRRTKEQLVHDPNSIKVHIMNRIDKIETPNNVKILGVKDHLLERTQDSTRLSTGKEIIDALSNPLNRDDLRINYNARNEPSYQYIGKKATVAVNPDTGMIITVWKTGKGKLKKYDSV